MTTKFIAAGTLLLALVTTTSAQTVVWTGPGLGIIGVSQSVPDPVTGAVDPFPGTPAFSLAGKNCPAGAGLDFEMTGVPIGYVSGAVMNEECWLVLAPGGSATPGTSIAGGLFYLPLASPWFQIAGGPALFIGPVDTICTGGTWINPVVTTPNRFGARFTLGAVPAGLGFVTAQAYLLDPNLGRVFTTNALNLQGL